GATGQVVVAAVADDGVAEVVTGDVDVGASARCVIVQRDLLNRERRIERQVQIGRGRGRVDEEIIDHDVADGVTGALHHDGVAGDHGRDRSTENPVRRGFNARIERVDAV